VKNLTAPKIDLEKIERLRKEKRISKAKMAKFLGLKTATGYHYLETGRCKISGDRLFVIAQILDVPVESLFYAPGTTETVAKSHTKAG